MLSVRSALRLLVISLFLVWAPRANAGLRLESRQWSGTQPISPATAKSIFNGLPVGGAGYGTADIAGIVPNGTSVSGSVPGGSSSNYGVRIAANFVVAANEAGPWTFEWGVDFFGGGVIFIDGVAIAENWNDDMWWAGNWGNASGVLSGTPTLAAGLHRIELYGFEDCCDGAMGARFKIGTGAFRDLNDTNLPTLTPDAPFGTPPAIGDVCLATGTESQGNASTCQEGSCDTSDSLCGVKNGVTCLSGAVKGCRAGVCHTDNRCGVPNGTTCATSAQCRGGVCGSDGKCGGTAGQACTVGTECRTGTCAEGKCGAAPGSSCTNAAECNTNTCGSDLKCGLADTDSCTSDAQCRRGVCDEDGKCGTPSGGACTVASTCRAGTCSDNKCGSAAGGVCSKGADCYSGYCGADSKCGFTNSSPCTRDVQCRALICGSDGLCGEPGGASCGSNAVCRSALCTASKCEALPVADAGTSGSDSGTSVSDDGGAASDAAASSVDSGVGGSTGTGSDASLGGDASSGNSSGGGGGGNEDTDGGGCSFHAGHGFGGALVLWAVSLGVLRSRRRRPRR